MEIGGEVYIQRRNGSVHLATIKEIDHRNKRVLVGFWESANLNLRLKNVDMNKVVQLNREIRAKRRFPETPQQQQGQQSHQQEKRFQYGDQNNQNVQEEPLNLKLDKPPRDHSPSNQNTCNSSCSSSPSLSSAHSTPFRETTAGIMNTSTPTYVSTIMESRRQSFWTPGQQRREVNQDEVNKVNEKEVEEIETLRRACSSVVMSPVPEVILTFPDETRPRSRPLKPPDKPYDQEEVVDELQGRKNEFKKAKGRELGLDHCRFSSQEKPNGLESPIRGRNFETKEQFEIFVLEEMLREEIQFSRDLSKSFVQNIKKLEEELKSKDEIISKLQTTNKAPSEEAEGEDLLKLDDDELLVNLNDERS